MKYLSHTMLTNLYIKDTWYIQHNDVHAINNFVNSDVRVTLQLLKNKIIKFELDFR